MHDTIPATGHARCDELQTVDGAIRPPYLAVAMLMLAAVAYGSLLPFQFSFSGVLAWSLDWVHVLRRVVTAPRWVGGPSDDLITNALLYLPVAVLLRLHLNRRGYGWIGQVLIPTMVVAAASWTLECAQALQPMRYASLHDWLGNTAGALAGALVAVMLRDLIRATLLALGRMGQTIVRRAVQRVRSFPMGLVLPLVICMVVVFVPLLRALTMPVDTAHQTGATANWLPFLRQFLMPYGVASLHITQALAWYAAIAACLTGCLFLARRPLWCVVPCVAGMIGTAELIKWQRFGAGPDLTHPILAAVAAVAVVITVVLVRRAWRAQWLMLQPSVRPS